MLSGAEWFNPSLLNCPFYMYLAQFTQYRYYIYAQPEGNITSPHLAARIVLLVAGKQNVNPP